MIPRALKPYLSPLRLWYVSTFARPVPELAELEQTTKVLYPKYVRNDDIVVEVGARVGAATLILAKLARQVYSFEPNNDNFRMLKAYTKRLQNVTAYNVALSDYEGSGSLNVSKNDSFSAVSSLKKIAGHEYVARQQVKVSTLDSFRFEIAPTSLVLDCEGAEAEVIAGGRKTIDVLRLILVETHVLDDGSSTIKRVIEALSTFQDRFTMVEEKVQGSNEEWLCFVRN